MGTGDTIRWGIRYGGSEMELRLMGRNETFCGLVRGLSYCVYFFFLVDSLCGCVEACVFNCVYRRIGMSCVSENGAPC